jgi:hypothetical protein
LALLTFWGAAPAAAQYKQLQPKIDVREAKRLIPRIASILRTPSMAAISAEDKQELDSYFLGYLFPAMSQSDPAALSRLSKSREVLFRQFIDAAKSAAVRQYLVETTIKAMGAFSVDNYHPAIRYNAVLVLANLDSEPAAMGLNAKPPVPLPEGTKALLLLLEQERIKEIIVPSSVKVGALVGLERHARFGMSDELKPQVEQACHKVIAQQERPADISGDVHGWMKCLAARVLVNLHSSAADAQTHAALTQLVADDKIALNERCYAARMFGRMKYAADPNLDTPATTLALGELAQDILAFEGKEAEKYEKELLGDPSAAGGFGAPMGGGAFGGGEGMMRSSGGYGGEGGGYGRGGFGGGYGGGFGGGMMEEQGPRYEKRRLLQAILSVTQAANAVKPAANEETQNRLESLRKPLQTVADAASDKDALEVDIVQDVMQLRTEINALVSSWTPEEEAPAEESEDDAFAEN